MMQDGSSPDDLAFLTNDVFLGENPLEFDLSQFGIAEPAGRQDDFLNMDLDLNSASQNDFMFPNPCLMNQESVPQVAQQTFDNNSSIFQEPRSVPHENVLGIFPNEHDAVDNPQDVTSLAKILDADVACQNYMPPPDSTNFKGECGFDIDFDTGIRDINYAFSAARDKLYISRDVPCAIRFVVKSPVPCSSQIRITSLYSEADQACYDVHRCITHAVEDFQKGVEACDHLIRCENYPVLYVRNTTTLRRSLIVPYQSPISGLAHSIYVIKFMCLNSCPGGMNRRPIKVICTLENSGSVIGRRSFAVKVCNSPLQDICRDDAHTKSHNSKTISSSKKRKMKDGSNHFADIFRFVDEVNHSCENNQKNQTDGPYKIVVRDSAERELILRAKALYEFVGFVRGLGPDMQGKLTNTSEKRKKPKP